MDEIYVQKKKIEFLNIKINLDYYVKEKSSY